MHRTQQPSLPKRPSRSAPVLPQVVLAGAPKCGTSTLFRWLDAHPRIGGSSPKETFYLMDEGHPLSPPRGGYRAKGLDGYAEFFQHLDAPKGLITLEATTHYIYQQTALKVLSNLRPQPKILFLLRNPADRVFSSFQYTSHNLGNISRSTGFADYVELAQNQPSELARRIKTPQSTFVLQRDIKYSQYADYLSHWRVAFGKENILVLLYEDLRDNPRGILQRVSDFLNIDPEFFSNFDYSAHNQTYRIRNPRFHRAARHVARYLPRSMPVPFTSRSVSVSELRAHVKQLYLAIQKPPRGPSKTEEELETLLALDRHFAPYNERLAADFGIDTTKWNTERMHC